ncbi:MAG: LacI family transcriptional regulator [Oscillospiraceae bacterium]|jgi:LacI family transcriptional regulator|nr:LacI family transcriptional regulator [Oscillospiraceae bacterium]
MVTVKDVAQHAGLSPSCVSKYFRDKNSVRNDSRVRIEAAVTALNYVPSDIARSLRGKRSNTIKALMPLITRPFFAEVFEYLHTPCRTAGYNLLLQTISAGETFTSRDFAFADGVIIAFPDDEKVIRQISGILGETGKPIVCLLGHANAKDCTVVSVDISQGMAEAAKYLLSSGRKRIAYVGGTDDSSPSSERFRGFVSIVEPERRHMVFRRDFSLAWGFRAAQYMLANLPDGVLCENDSIAAGVISCFLANGITVPGDVSVIGFDNTIIAETYWPSITSVSIPTMEMAEVAVRSLLNAVSGKPVCNQEFQSKLIVRESSSFRG